MAPALVFDVSSLVKSAGNMLTGIPRLQHQIAATLVGLGDERIGYCAFDAARGVFESISAEQIRLLTRTRPAAPGTPGSKSASRIRSAPASELAAHARQAGSHLKSAGRETRAWGRAALRSAMNRARAVPCASRDWDPSTTYCSIGADWFYGDLGYLAERKRERGFGVVLMAHDLIPIVAPQFLTVDLEPFFQSFVRVADTILVNSEATGRDLRVFARHQGLDMPEVARLPLASDLVEQAPDRPPGLERSLDGGEGRFVLTVGSLEGRKNLHLLLDVWELLVVERGGSGVPPLVIAGQRGWIGDETYARVTRTPSLRGVVVHLERPTDSELAWLYRECAFTLFPSLYEGWGLPVTESLDFGKLCITSDRSSLPEAGEGLTEMLDPIERGAWKHCVLRYWDDADLRARREERIREHHRRVDPTVMTTALLAIANREARGLGSA
jgi:glycosyltransferase involved in cell wall biosynthesis